MWYSLKKHLVRVLIESLFQCKWIYALLLVVANYTLETKFLETSSDFLLVISG